METKTCTHCGTAHEKRGIYCSKKCNDAAYRLRKKEEVKPILSLETMSEVIEEAKEKVKEVITSAFNFKVRLYHSLKFSREKSYCASPGTPLVFEPITEVEGETIYRVRKGKRNYYVLGSDINQ
jgi:hypothetical protein